MTSPWEIAAVLLAIAYLVLAIRQNPWCWAAAVASTSIYVVLLYQASLYMESALQFFYIAMAAYGWWCWTRGGETRASEPVAIAAAAGTPEALDATGGGGRGGPAPAPLAVSRWPLRRHLLAIGSVLALSLLSGSLLEAHTEAALPFLDSLTTWGAIVTTYLVARKILENWFYWFVIDGLSVYLYLSRELYLTAGLFLVYLVLVVVGYQAWRRAWLAMSNA